VTAGWHNGRVVLDGSARRAVEHVRALSTGGALDPALPVTLHFHPDVPYGDETVLASIAADGHYRSQFVTGVSNGGLTARPDGERWRWEQRMFAGAYDDAPATVRPVYGALDDRRSPYGGSPRFGSCYFQLDPQALDGVTFCFPDSVLEPTNVGTADRMALLPLLADCEFDEIDRYIEAQAHGGVSIDRDVSTLVLDPSYRGSPIELLARRLPCELRWHSGYRVGLDVIREHPTFRGADIVAAAEAIAVDGELTPSQIGDVRREGRFDLQTVKQVWHYLARFGRRDPAFTIGRDNPRTLDVIALLTAHLRFANDVTPPGHVHALDVDALVDPAITFCGVRGVGGVLLGVGALRRLTNDHVELKSMHTAAARRGAGTGRAMLDHLIAEAAAVGARQVSLETGTSDAFAPAHGLYRSAGFVECPPFGAYSANPHSVCMTRSI
jgi:GNAT superfamily N-acetyltransferase